MIKHTNMSFTFVTLSLMLTLTFLVFPVMANATTYYVATNGSNTPPYDTWAKASTSIQTAINNASNGDIIIVGSSDGHGTGTYTENVDVNKQVTIQSENGYNTTTVVAASSTDYVFEVTDDNVTINGFSIYGATGSEKAGIYLNSVTYCTIENNRCGWNSSYKNSRGIHLVSSSSCTINNTTASYNSGEGILLASSSSNTLTTNTTNNNSGDGISLSSSLSNTLTSNTANNNSFDGIRLVPSSNSNTLTSNTATGNGNNGFLIVASTGNTLNSNTANSNTGTNGFYLVSSSNNNTLNKNTANSNTGTGIRLENCSGNDLDSNTVTHNEFGMFLTSSSNNTITYNIMNENDGRVDGDGIMLTGSDNNVIANNTMNDDPGDGIEFYNSSNNTVMGNTLDNSGLIDPGASMRINYYSSNNTIINNTVINGAGGIVLEESSNYNFVSNNTITGHTGRGFEFWENASYNTLTCNNISNNGTYGIWLASGSYNTIYLNDISNNTTANIYSLSTTTTWHSPTTIYYDYNSGTFHKGYLGNYYSDGTHTGSNGIGGTYTIATDNDDDYQLMSTISNYSLQAWWLHSDDKMYRDDFTKAGGSVTISNGGTNIWISDQAALADINFSGSDTWTGQLVFTSAPTNGHTFTVEIGSSTDGSDFTAGGPDATLTGNGSSTVFTIATDASVFTVTTGKCLALRITSNHAEYSIRTGGCWSYISSSDNSTDYSLPVELTSFTANVSNGIATLNWQTETEVNNYGFDVERSQNIDWRKIGFVEGHGNSNSPKEYSFTDSDLLNEKIYYRLKQIDTDGSFEYFPDAFGIEVEVGIPTEFDLFQNYPNPFNPSTAISYQLVVDSYVQLKVYDVLGNEITTLVNEEKPAGTYEVKFSGSDLASGVYIYKLQTSTGFTATKKLILNKRIS